MSLVCEKGRCTSCGACVDVCPAGCISFIQVAGAEPAASRDEERCTDCGRCTRCCPSVTGPALNPPGHAYAAWSNDPDVHKAAASGGIATTLYKWALDNDMAIAGVALNGDFEARFQVSESPESIDGFRGSKYTFSYMDGVYEAVNELLKRKRVLFVGLPCQVAAMKKRAKTVGGGLVTVDLVCHGTPPPAFLKQHIKAIENRMGTRFEACEFRDSAYGSSKYMYTLYDRNDRERGKPSYKKPVEDDDLYQIGYHSAAIYRNCCYSCAYSRPERAGDLTLGDYHGLGRLAAYKGSKKEVSLVLTNSEIGEDILNTLVNEGRVTAFERPVEEPIRFEKQLNSPSTAPKERAVFIKKFSECGDFEEAAREAFSDIAKRNRINKFFHVTDVKRLARKILSDNFVDKVKYRIVGEK